MASTIGPPRARKKRRAKPPPFWVKIILRFFNVSIKLAMVFLVLYLGFVIYVEIYEMMTL